MSRQNYYVVTRPQGGWAVKKGGSQRASTVVDTQKKAIEIGRDFAKKNHGELTIQGKDNKFCEKNSCGNDPRNIKG